MKEPEYDIFAGRPDGEAMWIESVEGLKDARARMEQIAAEKPGQYFMFSTTNNAVLAKSNTTSQLQAKRKASGGAA